MEGIEYNFYQYIVDNAPLTIPGTVNGFLSNSPNDCFTVIKRDGILEGDMDSMYIDAIQVLVRAVSNITAMKEIHKIDSLFNNAYGIVLPTFNEGGIMYETLEVSRIEKVQTPGLVSADESDRDNWAQNYNLYGGN